MRLEGIFDLAGALGKHFLSQTISTREQGLKKYMAKYLCASERPYKIYPPVFSGTYSL